MFELVPALVGEPLLRAQADDDHERQVMRDGPFSSLIAEICDMPAKSLSQLYQFVVDFADLLHIIRLVEPDHQQHFIIVWPPVCGSACASSCWVEWPQLLGGMKVVAVNYMMVIYMPLII